jgi:predicted nucleotidyltransferase
MRLTSAQVDLIRQIVHEVVVGQVQVRLFGSRLDEAACGGDIDLMLDMPDTVANPALLSAQVAARISRAMGGRSVDVLISAPNLMRQPIHEIACKEGLIL